MVIIEINGGVKRKINPPCPILVGNGVESVKYVKKKVTIIITSMF